jgi:hypothetical protein
MCTNGKYNKGSKAQGQEENLFIFTATIFVDIEKLIQFLTHHFLGITIV